MVNNPLSSKRLQIDKANSSMVAILAAAAFLTVFSLVASKALLSQRSYQSRVVAGKETALEQLKANNTAAEQLVTSYETFVATPENIIGGSSTGTGDRDGDNAKIILDALPSKYDFPALATSMEKVLTARSYKIESISGTDDVLNQSQETQVEIKPVDMPYEVEIAGNIDAAQGMLDAFQLSIRPIHILKIVFTGADADLKVKVTAKSYYQPVKTINITKKVIE